MTYVQRAAVSPFHVGFLDPSVVQVTFVDGTRTLTVQPLAPATEFRFHINNHEFVKSAPENVAITDDHGLWFMYYDASGVLQSSQTPWLLPSATPVTTVYWNKVTQTSYVSLAWEAHSTADYRYHARLHHADGAQKGDGLDVSYTPGDGSQDTHAQVTISNGSIYDEDLEAAIAHAAAPSDPFEQILQGAAELPVWCLDGDTTDPDYGGLNPWIKAAATTFPFRYTPAGRANYNQLVGNVWQQTQIGNGDRGTFYICFGLYPTEPCFVVQGQHTYNSLQEAEDEVLGDLDLAGLPTAEIVFAVKGVIRTSNGYANTPQTIVEALSVLSLVSPSGSVQAGQAHSSTSGKDVFPSHPTRSISCAPTTIDNGDHQYAVTMLEDFLLFDGSGGAINANLPPVAGFVGQTLEVKCVAGPAGNCSFTPDGAETVDGVGGAYAFAFVGEALRLLAAATGWVIRP